MYNMKNSEMNEFWKKNHLIVQAILKYHNLHIIRFSDECRKKFNLNFKSGRNIFILYWQKKVNYYIVMYILNQNIFIMINVLYANQTYLKFMYIAIVGGTVISFLNFDILPCHNGFSF